jgi:hypothetical protein
MRQACLCVLLLLSLVSTSCRSSTSAPQHTGYVLPTVAGRPVATYASYQEGRQAFTRWAGSLRATLEDASWLRFEGTPAAVEAAHRAYFEYGYTTFDVELRSREYTQPTRERFLLEDSQGRRVFGQPLSFEGACELVDDRYFSAFKLSFRHMITADVTWIRLTREADGASVEWHFGAPPAPAR